MTEWLGKHNWLLWRKNNNEVAILTQQKQGENFTFLKTWSEGKGWKLSYDVGWKVDDEIQFLRWLPLMSMHGVTVWYNIIDGDQQSCQYSCSIPDCAMPTTATPMFMPILLLYSMLTVCVHSRDHASILEEWEGYSFADICWQGGNRGLKMLISYFHDPQ